MGSRVDTFYYAHWRNGLGFVWDMSRYLPWGQTLNGYTYPSEPVEIGPSEWFNGFLKQRVENQTQEMERLERERDAAVEELRGHCHSCKALRDCHWHDKNGWYHGDCESWVWRGLVEGETERETDF